MSSYALGRSPALWPDPLRFDPERFTPEAEAARHRFAWLPFGAGPRMCLGASFAQVRCLRRLLVQIWMHAGKAYECFLVDHGFVRSEPVWCGTLGVNCCTTAEVL